MVEEKTRRTPLEGCTIIWHDDDDIAMRCEDGYVAKQAQNYLHENLALGWLAHADGKHVYLQKPRPMEHRHVVDVLTNYHGLNKDADYIVEELKSYFGVGIEIPPEVGIGEVFEESLPRMRQMAGYEDKGYGTFWEGCEDPMVLDGRMDRIFDVMEEHVVVRRGTED